MLQVKNVSKSYNDKLVLDNISFTINNKEIVGFLGPNGAGKTTTMRIITDYISRDSGSVTIDGIDVTKDPIDMRRKIGYLPEQAPLYYEQTVYQYLKFIAGIRLIPKEEINDKIKYIIGKLSLETVLSSKIETLSKGFKQRVGLAQALIHDPQILILDEPTSGLDPNQIRDIRKLILEIAKEKTILFSTHILQEVEALCDRVIIINEGKIVIDKPKDQIKKLATKQQVIKLYLEGEKKDITNVFSKIKNVKYHINPSEKNNNHFDLVVSELSSKVKGDIRKEIYNQIKKTNLTILEMYTETTDLENVFQTLTNN